jgi:excisionase family DNA binding protein
MMQMNKLALTIDEAIAAGPIGRTKIYEAIGNGSLPARKIGGRTFILATDFEAWLQAQPLVNAKAA